MESMPRYKDVVEAAGSPAFPPGRQGFPVARHAPRAKHKTCALTELHKFATMIINNTARSAAHRQVPVRQDGTADTANLGVEITAKDDSPSSPSRHHFSSQRASQLHSGAHLALAWQFHCAWLQCYSIILVRGGQAPQATALRGLAERKTPLMHARLII